VNAQLIGAGALAAISLEWLGLGWLSGIRFPGPGRAAASASWALRLLVGAWLVAIAQLLLALLGVGFGSLPLVLGLAAIGAILLRTVRGPSPSPSPALHRAARQVPVDRRETVGWLLLGGVLIAALVRSFVVPEAGWDAFSHWGLRAQAFANARTLVNAHSEHEYYPPVVPLLEAWLYLHLGYVSIDLAKTIWAVVGGAFGVCLGWHARLALRPAWLAPYVALGIVLASTELLEGFWTGQADLALTACLCLATLAVWQWQQHAARGWLVQAGLFAAAATLIKFEGLPRIGVLAAAVLLDGLLSRRCRYWPAVLTLVVATVAADGVWIGFELGHGIVPNAEHVGGLQPLAIGVVALALFKVFGGVRTGGGVLTAILAWGVSSRILLEPPLRLLSLVVVGQALATLAAFLLSATPPDLEVATSATRLVGQFLPLALFVGALGLVGLTQVGRDL